MPETAAELMDMIEHFTNIDTVKGKMLRSCEAKRNKVRKIGVAGLCPSLSGNLRAKLLLKYILKNKKCTCTLRLCKDIEKAVFVNRNKL